jgi:histone acetyltransferase
MARQKAAILWKINATSSDHIVFPGIQALKNGKAIDPLDIPGLKETGWSREMDEQARKPKRPGHYAILQTLLTEMQNSPAAWPFVNPVSREDVPDYYEVIKEPMGKDFPSVNRRLTPDLTSMEFKLENDQYESVEQFIYDAKLIFNNCRSYNNETTTYYKNSTKLEKALHDVIKEKHDEYLNLL